MTLVVDATVAVGAVGSSDGFASLGDEDLVAPALMWSEARSTLHLALIKGAIALARLLGCRLVTLDGPLRRGADRLGIVVTPAEL